MPRWVSWVAGPLFFALMSASVQAQAENADRARTLFEAGLAHAEGERWAEAEASFSAAAEAQWSGQIAYNLAYARIQQGRFVEGVFDLDELLTHQDLGPEVRESAELLRTQVSHMVANVTVRMQGATEDVTVEVDGRPGTLNDPIPVDPGEHEVVALQNGVVVGRATTRLEAGESSSVVLTGLAASAVADAAPQESGGAPVGAIVGISVAAIAVIAAVIVIVLLAPFGADPIRGDLGEVGVRVP